MGTWSADMFGSDTAMDILGTLSHHLGYKDDEDGIYTMVVGSFNQNTLKGISERLVKNEYAVLRHKWYGDVETWPVIACVYLATGTPLSSIVKERAIRDCKKEIVELDSMGWQDDGKERKQVLEDLMNKIEDYRGEPVKIEHTGLFEKIESKWVTITNQYPL